MFDIGYRMLGAGAWGRSREMIWGGRWEGGSGLGTHVHSWQIHVNVWQNQYSIVKQNKVKIKIKKIISKINFKKELSRVFSSTADQKHQFFGTQPSYAPTLTSTHDYWKNHCFDHTDVCQQSDISAF